MKDTLCKSDGVSMNICKVKDCKRVVKYQGLCLCSKHYKRYKKYGDANSIINIFEKKPKICFENKYIVDKKTGCWNWIASKTIEGYGLFRFMNRMVRSHRFSWELYNGKIPLGKLVCHSCDNTSCVNPEHLWLGTDKDNAKDKVKKNRQWRPTGKKHPFYGKHLPLSTRKKISETVSKIVAKGEKHYNARLSKEDVLYIRNKYQKMVEKNKILKGEICVKLANTFDLSPLYVYQIIKRKKWKSV